MKKCFAMLTVFSLVFFSSCSNSESEETTELPASKTAVNDFIQTADDDSNDNISESSAALLPQNNNDVQLEITDCTNHLEMTDKEKCDIQIDKMLTSLIENDEETFTQIMYYIEGSEGYLYNNNIISYEILDSYPIKVHNDADVYYNYNVELCVGNETDSRFKEGISRWNIGMIYVGELPDWKSYCVYFIPEDTKELYVGGQNNYADLAYNFSYSFRYFGAIDNIQDFIQKYDNEKFTNKF